MTESEYQALGSFRYLVRGFLHFSEAAARAEGLEPQQHQLLLAVKALSQPDGPSIGALASHLFLRHHSAVGLVDRLAAHNLVQRVRLPHDGRHVRVLLTPAGEEKLERLSTLHREELRNSGPHLVAALAALLDRLKTLDHHD